ncbi:hypothetical protein [Acinetobacter brisouii]
MTKPSVNHFQAWRMAQEQTAQHPFHPNMRPRLLKHPAFNSISKR